MSIRHSLLAILAQGPCYGYQLRAEFDRRTGSTWPLNVGQVYNTLDRLVRDALVEATVRDGNDGVNSDNSAVKHTYYTLTEAGHRETELWFSSPTERYSSSRDELALKVALALTLPGVDTHRVIEHQRQATQAALDSLNHSASLPTHAATSTEFAQRLIADSMRTHAEAELGWLGHVDQMLHQAASEGRASAFPLNPTKPKRGRPVSPSLAEGSPLSRPLPL
jgi:DNA-binding PadR family transcriptional regulator